MLVAALIPARAGFLARLPHPSSNLNKTASNSIISLSYPAATVLV